ncbi:PREDICTED: B3 domain-containing protein REM9-like [Ipomoea nil]|uniref:B3 domain-containing protein REM9-like n=1 Tax=Ipomoea nil TaxID=35883 RepID=UPI000900A430|nr:PREDICTED: B3 domain-containing protein REM9-like [Ipomoea nil]XP_019175026.1 PREDICTED: B3 domain-containing protein REM9-like [Ipomoea nil]
MGDDPKQDLGQEVNEQTPSDGAGTSRKRPVTSKFLSSNLPIGWRFFKVMRPGFHTRLNLPPILCKKLGEKKPEEVVLTGQNGSFKVKIQEGKDQRLCFTEGWDDFVGQNGISLGDFAVFEHMDSFHFSVVLFDQTCCQKNVHVNPETSSNDSEGGKSLCTGQENSSCFTTTIKAYNVRSRAPYMHIPRKFCTSNNLLMSTSITLRGPCGKLWPAKLRTYVYGKTSGDYACIYDGWKEFATHYDLKERDVCSFRFVPRPTSYCLMVDVKIIPAC